MTISARVICDSSSVFGVRLTTVQLRYPKFIHGELMTHRVFSRNASSSRAIPVERLIEDVRRNPAMPIYWGSNKPGMQAGEELDEDELARAKRLWLNAMGEAVHRAQGLIEIGLHKQIANRTLQPWSHINTVVTATEWSNFFALRLHKDAQPEMHMLAKVMNDAIRSSDPKMLAAGEWHLPYVTEADRNILLQSPSMLDSLTPLNRDNPLDKGVHCYTPHEASLWYALIRISTARCARVSYLTHEAARPTIRQDLDLYERLVGAHPMHASPAEHQATPDHRRRGHNVDGNSYDEKGFPITVWSRSGLHGNLRGWIQHRKLLKGEYQ